MSDYSFTEAEKVAIYRADGEKCFYCQRPVEYNELQVDHIVPEKISAEALSKLRAVLPPDFAVNSIPNWATCHQGCNIRKSSFIFETTFLLYCIQMATKRAQQATKIMEEFQYQKQNGRLLGTLRVRLEKGHLTQSAVLAVLGALPAVEQKGADPWVVAFGIDFAEALPVGAPEHDPELSDWLLSRLERDIASMGAVFHHLDDERTGEGVSVRHAFWILDLDAITQTIDHCWDVLTVQRYSEVFGHPADDLLNRAVVSRYHEIVHSTAEDDPVGVSHVPGAVR